MARNLANPIRYLWHKYSFYGPLTWGALPHEGGILLLHVTDPHCCRRNLDGWLTPDLQSTAEFCLEDPPAELQQHIDHRVRFSFMQLHEWRSKESRSLYGQVLNLLHPVVYEDANEYPNWMSDDDAESVL